MTSILPRNGPPAEKADSVPSQTTRRRYSMAEKMPSARRFLTLFFGLLITAGLANAVLGQQSSKEVSTESKTDHAVHRDDSTFSRLLSSASPQSLHEFLHAYFPGTYKHGVYDSDHSAMEVIHANDPELATSIVQMAKRQQSGNDTTSVTTSTATDSETTTSASETSTTEETSTSDTSSTSMSSPSDTSTSISTETTTTQTNPTTTTSTSDSTEATSTPDSTLATTTTSSASTTRPPRTSTFTSTLPGGAVTTMTSVEVVTPGAPEEASTTGSSGSLQSGPALPLARKPAVEVIIGVLVGGAFLV